MLYFNEIFTAANADEAFLHWYGLLSNNMDTKGSRDGNVVGEIINAVTIIEDPTRGIMFNDTRKMSMRYAVGEMLWYLSGSRKLDAIGKYTKAWERMSDDGENVNSNYGYCIMSKYGFNQYEFIKKMLTKTPDSRQAVIHIKEPNNKPSKDVNCTVCLQFFVRDGKLYMTVYMRSNDIWMGFPFDVFQFTSLQVMLAMELGLDLGTYTHVTGSLHLYERNAPKESEAKNG